MVSINNVKAASLIELGPFFDRIETLYGAIDDTYEEAAGYYGFRCSGCEDNCCMTHFYHHTYIEFFYIVKGFRSLPYNLKNDILSQASAIQEKKEKGDSKIESSRLMCPLNIDGKCVIYKHRPMICRMHGIPHELKRPGTPVLYGQGCDAFVERHFNDKYVPFDRTPFYFTMAHLENDMKRENNLNGKFKKTVFEMFAT
jgi:Fe-S-cluster containining protein